MTIEGGWYMVYSMLSEEVREYFRKEGKKGGDKLFKEKGIEYYKKISKLAAKQRKYLKSLKTK